MNPLEIAVLKDDILRYLLKNRIAINVDAIKKDLNLYEIPPAILNTMVLEMDKDDTIIASLVDGYNHILKLGDKAEKLLSEGGYTKIALDKLNDLKRMEENDQKFREKTELEIENLRASIANFANTPKRANWALFISIVAIIVTILLKIIFK